MSDVLHLAKEGALLLTGLTHPTSGENRRNGRYCCDSFVRNKFPPPETIHLAEEKGVPYLPQNTPCSRLADGFMLQE
jgi:hypothetical protein